MLPGAPDYPTVGGYGQARPSHAISQKEEMARAALRSLAAPSHMGSSTSAYPSIAASPAAPFGGPRFSRADTDQALYLQRWDLRPSGSHHALGPGGSLRRGSAVHADVGEAEDARTSTRDGPALPPLASGGGDSYFGLPRLTASPTTSPRLHGSLVTADPDQPSPYSRDPPSLSISSSASTPAHESIPSPDAYEATLRRVATSLRLGYEEVRYITHHLSPSHIPRYVHASGSSSAMLHRVDPATAQLVLDALRAEDERSAQVGAFRDAYIRRQKSREAIDLRPPPPPGQLWADGRASCARHTGAPQHRQTPSQPFASRYGEARDDRHRSHDAHSMQAAPPLNERRRSILAGSASPHSSVAAETVLTASPRSSSPSPFAFDPLRRPSLPPISAMTLGEAASASASERSSLDSGVDSPRRRWRSGSGSDKAASPYLGHRSTPHAARKGRSIDDYLESCYSRQLRRPSRSRDTFGHALMEVEGTLLSSSRHPYQPYPPVSQRQPNPLQLTQTQSWSPNASYAPLDSPSQYPSGLPRRPQALGAGPSGKAALSHASSGFSHSQSPASYDLGALLCHSPGLDPEAGDPLKTLEGAGQRPGRCDGVLGQDPKADLTRAGVVEHMQIDKGQALAGADPKQAVAISGSASAPRSETPSASGQLSREEILMRLQNKVKARIAAKQQNATSGEGQLHPDDVYKEAAAFNGRPAKARASTGSSRPSARSKAAASSPATTPKT
ncbi:hypothetical protein ACQY0O_002229 [Thecaphora frezii]